MIAYEELAKLRMSQFWPAGTNVHSVDSMSCLIGDGNGEQIRFSYFLWPPGSPQEVAEVRLEAFPTSDCPASVAQAVINRLGIPLTVGESANSAIAKMGPAVSRSTIGELTRLVWHVSEGPHYAVYALFGEDGLCHLLAARSDRVKRWPDSER